MTATLAYERLNHHTCPFPYDQIQSAYGKSYYKLYQLKLRQLFVSNPFQREDHVKTVKQKQVRPQESMNKALNDENGKRATSVLSITRRRTRESTMYTITSTEVSASTSIAPPKSVVKTRQSSSLTKHQRIISAPINRQKSARKKTAIKMPTVEIDDTDEELSKSNACYTQAVASSQDLMEENNQYARQSTMNTIMLHLKAATPADLSKWNLYRDFDEKISASVSPRVYRNHERIIL